MSFEERLAKVDDIVKKLSSGETSLEEALELYREGTEKLTECSRELESAREKTLKITKGEVL